MNTNRYIREKLNKAHDEFDASWERNEPVKAKEVKRTNPVSILEKHLLRWPPRDVRFDPTYQANHDFESTDSLFMEDIAKGMIVKTIERLPKENSIIVGVYLQSNLAEFERYNLIVDKHNYEWEEQGCPEDVFDPFTGDISRIKDTYVKPAEIDDIDYEPSDGPLALARPEVKRDLYIKIKFRLDIDGDNFKIGFVAYDAKDLVIFYDVIEDDNVAYLTRRATQELFGHPFIYGSEGPLLDGIALLIQGKKLPLCHKNCEIPDWPEMHSAECKSSNPALTLSNLNQIFYRVLGIAFGYIIPIMIFWNWIVVKTYHALITFGDKQYGRFGNKGDPTWMPTIIIACVLLVVSFLIAKYCYRKTNVEKLTSKLL